MSSNCGACSFCSAPFQKASGKFCGRCGTRRASSAQETLPPSTPSASGKAAAASATSPAAGTTSSHSPSPSSSTANNSKFAAGASSSQPPPRPSTATTGGPPAKSTAGSSAKDRGENEALSKTASPAMFASAMASSTTNSGAGSSHNGASDRDALSDFTTPPTQNGTGAAAANKPARPSSSSSHSSSANNNNNNNSSGSGNFTQVTKYLQMCNLEGLLDKFIEANINDEALPFVEEEDLTAVGIGVGAHRRKLLAMFVPKSEHFIQQQQQQQKQQLSPLSSSSATSSSGSGTMLAHHSGIANAAPISTVQVPNDGQVLSPEVLETANANVLRRWVKGELLGRGANGCVYAGLVPSINKFYAVKTIPLNLQDPNNAGSGLRARDIIKISREIAMMRRVQHENCVSFYGAVYSPEEREIQLFLELVTGGCLGAVASKFRPLPLEIIREWTRQLFAGIAYLHSLGVAHRDLKAANVLLAFNSGSGESSGEARLKLADFGAAKRLTENLAKANTVVGSPYFLAPEILLNSGEGYDPMLSDVWSAAITVCEMMTGHPPWREVSNAPQAILMIASNDGALPNRMPAVGQDGMTPELLAFLTRCLSKDPSKRPTAAQCLNDPFFTNS